MIKKSQPGVLDPAGVVGWCRNSKRVGACRERGEFCMPGRLVRWLSDFGRRTSRPHLNARADREKRQAGKSRALAGSALDRIQDGGNLISAAVFCCCRPIMSSG